MTKSHPVGGLPTSAFEKKKDEEVKQASALNNNFTRSQVQGIKKTTAFGNQDDDSGSKATTNPKKDFMALAGKKLNTSPFGNQQEEDTKPMKYQPPPKNTNTVKTVPPQNIKEDEAAQRLKNHQSAP